MSVRASRNAKRQSSERSGRTSSSVRFEPEDRLDGQGVRVGPSQPNVRVGFNMPATQTCEQGRAERDQAWWRGVAGSFVGCGVVRGTVRERQRAACSRFNQSPLSSEILSGKQ